MSGLSDFTLGEGGAGDVASGGSGTGVEVGGSGGVGAGGSGAGGVPPPLSDEGLVVRYYLDETDRGMGPSEALDAAPDPQHLILDYGTGNMEYQSVSGRRGLVWASQLSDGAAMGPVQGKVHDALDGATEMTLEVVFVIETVDGQCPRLFDISRTTNLGQLAFCFDNATVELRLNAARSIDAPFTVVGTGRHVGHIILDTTLPTAPERARYLHDGVEVATGTSETSPNEGIELQFDDVMALGNRLGGSRSLGGWLFYVAIYDVAFDTVRAAEHAASLKVRDDQAP